MLNDLLGDLLGLSLSVTSNQDGLAGSTGKRNSGIGLEISIRINSVGTLEGIRQGSVPRHRFVGTEPVVDVIEAKNAFKIIIIFPGIKKEDVRFNVKDDIVEVEIDRNGYFFKKEVLHHTKAEQISIKSSTINNSVLEATFIKK